MPVQLPTVNRFAPQAPQTVGRIQTQVPDGSQAFGALTEQVAKGAGAVAENFMKAEEQAADLTALQASVERNTVEEVELAKLRAIEGDPTEAYAEYDRQYQVREQEFLKKYEGASGLTRSKIQEKLTRSRALLYEKRHVNEASQFSAYAKKTDDSAVSLSQDGMLDASQVLNVEQPDSFLTLRAHIDDIRKTRIEAGRRNGFVSTDENGNERLSPYLVSEIKKDVSTGLQNVIKTLNDAGRVEEANQLLNEYHDDLTAKARTDLISGNKDARINNEALAAVDKIRYLNPEAGLAQINKIQDLSVREKAMDKWDTYQRQIKQQKDRASEQAFEDASEYVRKRQESGQNLVDINDLHDDKVFKSLVDRMDSKSVSAIEELVEAPKHSNEKALETAYNTMFKGGFAGMSPAQFDRTMHGLSSTDRTMFRSQYVEANKESGAEQSKMVSYMGTQLTKQMQAAGIIKEQNGRYDNKSEIKNTQYYNEMMAIIDTMPPNASIQDQQKAVMSFVNAKLKEEAFTSFGGGTRKMPSAPPASTSAVKGQTMSGTPVPKSKEKPSIDAPPVRPPSREEKQQMAALWYKTYKRPFDPSKGDTPQQMKELWNKQGGK